MPYTMIKQNRIKRFMKSVEILEDGCWRWTGWKTKFGYGGSSLNGKQTTAHRVAYLLLKGEYDQTLDLDHLCRRRDCVNPDHLGPVTRSVNLRRGYEARGCKKGHPFTEENMSVVHRSNGKTFRRCKICHRETNRRAAG